MRKGRKINKKEAGIGLFKKTDHLLSLHCLGCSPRLEGVRVRQLRQKVCKQNRSQQPLEEGPRPGFHFQLSSLRQQIREEERPAESSGRSSRAGSDGRNELMNEMRYFRFASSSSSCHTFANTFKKKFKEFYFRKKPIQFSKLREVSIFENRLQRSSLTRFSLTL